MTTISPPSTFSQLDSAGLTFDRVFGQAQLTLAMMDTVDLSSFGVLGLRGDVAGSGSDTIRDVYFDDVGYGRRASALATETSAITPSQYAVGYNDVTIGMYGLGHRATFYENILMLPQNHMTMDQLISMVPSSWRATVRYLTCVEATSISTAIGAAGTNLSVDDYIALQTATLTTYGASSRGAPKVVIEATQLSQLIASFRTEPAFQANIADFSSIQGVQAYQSEQVIANFAKMGMDVLYTSDVQQSGGAYQGFAVSPGGMGWVRASTSNARLPAAVRPMYVPEYGILIYEMVDTTTNMTVGYNAIFLFGVARGSTDVYLLRRLISKV